MTSGPYETEHEAVSASLYVQRGLLGTGRDMTGANLDELTDACAAAGVTVGAYDARILRWLADYEPQTCAVVAGLIARAHAGP